jgi:hypothetical protein
VLEIFHFGVEGKIADVNGHEKRGYGQIRRNPWRKLLALGRNLFELAALV